MQIDRPKIDLPPILTRLGNSASLFIFGVSQTIRATIRGFKSHQCVGGPSPAFVTGALSASDARRRSTTYRKRLYRMLVIIWRVATGQLWFCGRVFGFRLKIRLPCWITRKTLLEPAIETLEGRVGRQLIPRKDK